MIIKLFISFTMLLTISVFAQVNSSADLSISQRGYDNGFSGYWSRGKCNNIYSKPCVSYNKTCDGSQFFMAYYEHKAIKAALKGSGGSHPAAVIDRRTGKYRCSLSD